MTNGSRSSSVRTADVGSSSAAQIACGQRPCLCLREPRLVGVDAGKAVERGLDRRAGLGDRDRAEIDGVVERAHLDPPVDRPDEPPAREREDPGGRERLDREPAGPTAEPRDRPCRLDQACPQAAVRGVELGDLVGSGSRRCEARADGVAPQLVEEEAARGAPRQRDLLERREVRREVAAKVIVDERELGCEHGASVELDLLLEHEPLEHEARGDVTVADRPGERVDGDRADLSGGERAQDAGRQVQLPDGERRIEVRPRRTGPAAEFWSRTHR